MRVLICPAAGLGTRFSTAGYTVSKPLIMCAGKPMFVRAIEPLMPFVDCALVLFSQSMRPHQHAIDAVLDMNDEGARVMAQFVTPQPEGAALTVLCAQGNVSDSDEILIVNSDQIFEDAEGLARWFRHIDAHRPDGSILVFSATGNQWSYVRPANNEEAGSALHPKNAVVEVAEKRAISELATCGAYYFRSWQLLRMAIARMIAANDRTNNEFYLAPAYNHILAHHSAAYISYGKLRENGYWCVGTPELLQAWEAHHEEASTR